MFDNRFSTQLHTHTLHCCYLCTEQLLGLSSSVDRHYQTRETRAVMAGIDPAISGLLARPFIAHRAADVHTANVHRITYAT